MIPALNEAGTIRQVVQGVAYAGDVIVVDDGSTDQTATLAHGAGAVVIRHLRGKGYDHAINSGIEFARQRKIDAVITFDADGQHDPDALQEILDLLELEQCDLVIGIRSRSARFSEYLFNRYVLYRFGVKDILCGLKGYRLNKFSSFRLEGNVGSIGTKMALDGLRRRLKTCSVSVRISSRHGKPRVGSLLRANYRIGRALLRTVFDDLARKPD